MRMFLLNCGIMKFPNSIIIRNETTQNSADKLVSVPIAAFLIEHDDGWILFDTGCDPNGMKGSWPENYRQIPFEEKYLPESLDALNIRADDIQTVVASHLHFDHAGCLHLFKKARIYVSQSELEKMMYAYENKRDLNAHLESDIRNMIQADLTWETISSDVKTFKLADGVTIINLGSGHSWGILGLMIELPVSGNYFLISDAIYTKENHGPPQKLPSMLCDEDGYRNSVNLIEEYASKNNATIFYGHDVEQFTTLFEKTNGCME